MACQDGLLGIGEAGKHGVEAPIFNGKLDQYTYKANAGEGMAYLTCSTRECVQLLGFPEVICRRAKLLRHGTFDFSREGKLTNTQCNPDAVLPRPTVTAFR